MSRFPSWMVAAAVFVIGALGYLLWFEHREVIGLRTEVARSNAAVGQFTKVLPLKLDQQKPAQSPSVASEGVVTGQESPDKPHPLSDPAQQMRLRMIQYHRWLVLGKYSHVLAGLDLPPDELVKFKILLLERDQAEDLVKDSARDSGADPNSSDTTAAVGKAQGEVDKEIGGLLGEADYQKYGELIGADVIWENVDGNGGITGYFVDSGVPLTAEQTTSLAQMFYRATMAAAKMRTNNEPLDEPDPVTGLKPFQKMILDQAKQTFPDGQLEALRNYFLNDNDLGALIKDARSQTTP